MDTDSIPTEAAPEVESEETSEDALEADAEETAEPTSEVEGVEQEGGHVFYGYDDSNAKVDANAHSEAE